MMDDNGKAPKKPRFKDSDARPSRGAALALKASRLMASLHPSHCGWCLRDHCTISELVFPPPGELAGHAEDCRFLAFMRELEALLAVEYDEQRRAAEDPHGTNR